MKSIRTCRYCNQRTFTKRETLSKNSTKLIYDLSAQWPSLSVRLICYYTGYAILRGETLSLYFFFFFFATDRKHRARPIIPIDERKHFLRM